MLVLTKVSFAKNYYAKGNGFFIAPDLSGVYEWGGVNGCGSSGCLLKNYTRAIGSFASEEKIRTGSAGG
jgi:hypothetical protein